MTKPAQNQVVAYVPYHGLLVTMYYGRLVDLEEGWARCDGGTYNGVYLPDFRDTFLRGTNNFATFNTNKDVAGTATTGRPSVQTANTAAAVGSNVANSIYKGHTHTLNYSGNTVSGEGGHGHLKGDSSGVKNLAKNYLKTDYGLRNSHVLNVTYPKSYSAEQTTIVNSVDSPSHTHTVANVVANVSTMNTNTATHTHAISGGDAVTQPTHTIVHLVAFVGYN
jgi:hypothetical protein